MITDPFQERIICSMFLFQSSSVFMLDAESILNVLACVVVAPERQLLDYLRIFGGRLIFPEALEQSQSQVIDGSLKCYSGS
jgi:hypothetical protein